MGMRLGILLGFLGGAVARTIAGKPDATKSGPVAKVRTHVRRAIEAGKEAAADKEEEIRKDYERTVRQ